MKTPDQDIKFAASTVDEQIDGLTDTQDEQLLASSLNARMMRDLYQIYDHASYSRQLELSLERIGQHLESKRAQSIEVDKQHMPPVKVKATTLQTQNHSKKKNTSDARSSFVSRLASLAAVFFVTILVGSLLLTLLATRQHGSVTSGNQIISVHMGPASFLTPSVILRLGMSLELVNDNPVVHIIDNGYWGDNQQKFLLHEPGMPKSPINFETIHETHLIGPFNTIGTYHLFDEIHVNMNLTIRVQLSGTPGVVTPTPVENAVRVHLEQQAFLPDTITIRRGTSLLLINDTLSEEHIIMNGYWKDNHIVYVVARGKPVPAQVSLNLQGNPNASLEYVNGQGLPVVDIVFQPGNSEQVIGPFTTAGTYSFLDTIHIDANLTVVVK